MARIRAALRRNRPPSSSSPSYDDGYLKVDPQSHQVFVNRTEVAFSPKEWRVLECLISCKDRVVSREELFRSVWGNGYKAEFQYLKVFVSRIRGKLNDEPAKPRYIHTERKLGYRFESHD